MNILKIRLAALLLLALLTTSFAHAAGLVIENAWIAEAPPVSKVLAGYMDIRNESKHEIKIVAVTSADFGNIEFHRTLNKNGMATMQMLDELTIPAGGELKLQPGDFHMMLFRPARALTAGDASMFHFKLANGHTIDVETEVKKAVAEESHEHHQH